MLYNSVNTFADLKKILIDLKHLNHWIYQIKNLM